MSAYRFLLDSAWHVAVIGDPPPVDLERKLPAILTGGEPVMLPEDILRSLPAGRLASLEEGLLGLADVADVAEIGNLLR